MRNIGFLVLILIIIPVGNALSEINNREVQRIHLNACVAGYDETFSISYEKNVEICKCTTKKVMREFNLIEYYLFAKKVEDQTESEANKIFAANKKLHEISISCVREVLNQ